MPTPERRALAEALMLNGRDLSGEQRMLVHEAACRPDRVVCVVGVAGSGKTLGLRSVADAYRGIDVTVLGAAPSGRAADELENATGFPSRTLHRLLLDVERNGGLPHGCVLVIDEAGMAETRVLAPLLHAVDRAEGKLLLVGDPAQLPAVGAGGLYQALCDRLDPIELSSNRRQRDPLEREALAHLRAGDPEPYLAHAARHGRLAVDEDPILAKERLLADWWREARRNTTRSAMLPYYRHDVDELNTAAHALMLHHRRLGRDAVTLGEREFRVGDHVLCRRNDNRLELRNGLRGTVVALDDEALLVRDETPTLRRGPFDYASEHLDYGYALTGHAAQGATVDRAFVLLGDEGALQEWGYVTCSRARVETRLYLADRDTLERETPLREPDPAPAPGRAARALERLAAEPLALDATVRRDDANVRLHARREEDLERQRAETAERLATAQRELKQLGWWKRGGRRLELEGEIGLYQTSLRIAEERRAQLALAAPPSGPVTAPERGHDELTRAPSLQRTLSSRTTIEREPPSLGLDL